MNERDQRDERRCGSSVYRQGGRARATAHNTGKGRVSLPAFDEARRGGLSVRQVRYVQVEKSGKMEN